MRPPQPVGVGTGNEAQEVEIGHAARAQHFRVQLLGADQQHLPAVVHGRRVGHDCGKRKPLEKPPARQFSRFPHTRVDANRFETDCVMADERGDFYGRALRSLADRGFR